MLWANEGIYVDTVPIVSTLVRVTHPEYDSFSGFNTNKPVNVP